MYLVPGMLLVLAIAGGYLDTLVDDQLTEYFDTTLDAKARSIVALTEQDEDGVELELYSAALPTYSQDKDPDYFRITTIAGDTLFSSPSMSNYTNSSAQFDAMNLAIVKRVQDDPDAKKAKLSFFNHKLPDGRSGRWAAVAYFPRIDPDDDEFDASDPAIKKPLTTEMLADAGGSVMVNGVLIKPERVIAYVGTSRTDLDNLMWAINLILLLTGIVIATAIVLIARFGIRRAIAPLNRLGQDIAAVDEKSLDSQIKLSKPVVELDVLVDQFNHLLKRLRTAFNRERKFSADVAHELRTPIAEMKTLIEVQARFPDNQLLSDSFSDDLLASTERMQHIVEQLLALSNTEREAIDIGGSVNLVALVDQLVENYKAKAALQNKEISFTHNVGSLLVPGDQIWPMVLTNVLENAIDHSNTSESITVDITATENTYKMCISNPCDNLNKDDIDHMLERLWTKDESRTDSSHSGLGLALVAAYTRSLGVNLQPALQKGNGDDTKLFSITFSGNSEKPSDTI